MENRASLLSFAFVFLVIQIKMKVLTLLLLFLCLVKGYFVGEPVRMFKRTQFMEQRTLWSDVLIGQAPLFGRDSEVELHGISKDLELKEDDTLKMSPCACSDY